jgi:hypothetical protein
MTTKPVVKSVNLFEWIGERMIQRIESEPITVDVRCADGTITMEIPPKHPWYKELSRRRTEQVQQLRASFKTSMGAHKFPTDQLGDPEHFT